MIESVIQTILAQARPNVGDDLAGFQTDADFALANDIFVNPSVERTADPACMLDLRADLAPHASSLNQLRNAVWTLWGSIRYAIQATQWTVGDETAELRFVTASADLDLCVTGRLVIGGTHYARLRGKGR